MHALLTSYGSALKARIMFFWESGQALSFRERSVAHMILSG